MSRHEVNVAFETLEPKILLAGNVEVKETGAGLKITGDVESNYIRMARVDADNVQITGVGGTTVNGAANGQFEIGGANVKLDFKQGGNDSVEFTFGGGAELELNKVKGRFGTGNDEVLFHLANTTQQVGLKMGDGNDSFRATSSSLRGKVTIQTGQDNDVITFQGGDDRTLGKTSIVAGEGSDIVNVLGFGTAGVLAQLSVALGEGNDAFTGSGNKIPGKATVDGGGGSDSTSGTDNRFTPGNPIVTNVETRAGQW